RTLWDNQDLYLTLSPFLFADQIKEPVLLIHGYKDANAATPYHQSTLMYEAIVENGGQARLVVLPEDGHNVTTTDGVLQVASEILSWTGENHDR
ncbi:MAG: prolyl oligopeptidase family serine peptidase, partial [Pseudomonadota bacterium]